MFPMHVTLKNTAAFIVLMKYGRATSQKERDRSQHIGTLSTDGFLGEHVTTASVKMCISVFSTRKRMDAMFSQRPTYQEKHSSWGREPMKPLQRRNVILSRQRIHHRERAGSIMLYPLSTLR